MNLFEYQAKEAFRECGITTPRGVLVRSVEELDAAFAETGFPCVLKSQVLREAGELFASGHNVRMLLVEQAVDIAREIYLSMTVDPVSGTALLMGCAEGGVDIESLAATQPEKIVRVHVDMAEGLGGYHVNNLIYGMGLSGEEAKQVGAAARGLYKVFRARTGRGRGRQIDHRR